MAQKTKTQLLLVEDSPADARFIQMLLDKTSLAYDLRVAPSLMEAELVLQRFPAELALLDLSLPDTTGFKTLTRFLQRHPGIPVIVLTSTNNEIIGIQSIKAGAQDFLVKGEFDGKLLSRAIRYALQRYKAQVQLQGTAQKLNIREKRITEVQSLARFGFWELNLVNQQMTWSDQVFRTLEKQAQSLSPTLSDFLSFFLPVDRQRVERFFDLVSKDGKPRQVTCQIQLGANRTKPVLLSAKVVFDDLTGKWIVLGSLQEIARPDSPDLAL